MTSIKLDQGLHCMEDGGGRHQGGVQTHLKQVIIMVIIVIVIFIVTNVNTLTRNTSFS